MNRITVIVIAVVALALGGFLFLAGDGDGPAADPSPEAPLAAPETGAEETPSVETDEAPAITTQ
ncbi:MAG: hypothetical protein AAF646_07840 [Pseudomonadota bacterium]